MWSLIHCSRRSRASSVQAEHLEIRNLVVTKVSRTGISIFALERLRSQPVVQNAFAVHADCHCRSNS